MKPIKQVQRQIQVHNKHPGERAIKGLLYTELRVLDLHHEEHPQRHIGHDGKGDGLATRLLAHLRGGSGVAPEAADDEEGLEEDLDHGDGGE